MYCIRTIGYSAETQANIAGHLPFCSKYKGTSINDDVTFWPLSRPCHHFSGWLILSCCCYLGRNISTTGNRFWSCLVFEYGKVASLEAHTGTYRFLMKGIFDDYILWPFDKKLIFELVMCVNTRDFTVCLIFHQFYPLKSWWHHLWIAPKPACSLMIL